MGGISLALLSSLKGLTFISPSLFFCLEVNKSCHNHKIPGAGRSVPTALPKRGRKYVVLVSFDCSRLEEEVWKSSSLIQWSSHSRDCRLSHIWVNGGKSNCLCSGSSTMWCSPGCIPRRKRVSILWSESPDELVVCSAPSMAARGLGGPAGPPELWWWRSHEGWSLAAGPRRRNGWSVDKVISWSGYQLIKIICIRVWWLSQRNRRRGLICGVKELGLAGCGYVVPCWLSPSRYVQGVLPLPKQIFLFFWKPSRKKCK